MRSLLQATSAAAPAHRETMASLQTRWTAAQCSQVRVGARASWLLCAGSSLVAFLCCLKLRTERRLAGETQPTCALRPRAARCSCLLLALPEAGPLPFASLPGASQVMPAGRVLRRALPGPTSPPTRLPACLQSAGGRRTLPATRPTNARWLSFCTQTTPAPWPPSRSRPARAAGRPGHCLAREASRTPRRPMGQCWSGMTARCCPTGRQPSGVEPTMPSGVFYRPPLLPIEV